MRQLRKKKFKTLKGAFRSFQIKRLTFSDLLCGQLYDNSANNWRAFELSDDAYMEFAELLAGSIWSTKKSQGKYIKLISEYCGRQFGIYSRMWVELQENGELVGTYCAGQDWNSEIRCIQNCLRKGY